MPYVSGIAPETQLHLVSACRPMSKVKCKIRHYAVAKSPNQQTLRAEGVDYKRGSWWKKTPPRAAIPHGGYLRWDPKLRTKSGLEHDNPDVLLKTPPGNSYIIEFTVCTDQAVVTRHYERMTQYQPLANDIGMTLSSIVCYWYARYSTRSSKRKPADTCPSRHQDLFPNTLENHGY